MKRFLSAMLASVMMFTSAMTTIPAAAENMEQQTDVSMSDDLQITATNSFGSLLSDAVNTELNEQEANTGFNVFDIEVDGKTARASIETLQDSVLVVGVYTEDCSEMIVSGSVNVEA